MSSGVAGSSAAVRSAARVDARLAAPAVSAWLASFLAISFLPQASGLAAALPIAGWVLAGAVFLLALRRRHSLLPALALALAVVAACLSAVAIGQERRMPAALLELAESEGRAEVLVVTQSDPNDGRVIGAISAIATDEGWQRLDSPALLFGLGGDIWEDSGERSGGGDPEAGTPEAAPIPIGSTLRATVRLRATDPGDARAFLAFAVGGVEFVQGPTGPLATTGVLRAEFQRASSSLGGQGADLLPGLAIGDVSAVDERLDRDMKLSALSHLTAVSGSNCAVVVGLVAGVAGALGASRMLRSILAALALLGFVVLVTPEPSVQRAAVMAAVALVGIVSGRPARGLSLLCVAMVGLLLLDPWMARSFGFVLSVLATGGLLLLAGPLTTALERVMPRPIAAIVAIPLAAQLACQPVILLLDASVPSYGVVANVLAAPAAPVATVIGLLACVALPIVPPLGMLLTQVAWLPSSWIAAVAGFSASLPLARLPWLGGAAGLVLLSAASGVLVAAMLARERRRRVGAIAGVLLVVGAYLGASAGVGLARAGARPADWQFAQCDVGQGDAVLVRSGGQTMLIDTGEHPQPLVDCLRELGISRLDTLLITHFDLDHVGGVSALVGRVDRVLTGMPEDERDRERLRELAAGGASVEAASVGMGGELGDLLWRVVWPEPESAYRGNDGSVVVEIRPGAGCRGSCASALLLGDLGERTQNLLLRRADPAPVDVVKVSHHGSADQSAALYRQLDAAAGLIGVGADNGYGHPAPSILGVLAETGTAALRSDERGLVLIAEREGALTVWSEREPVRELVPVPEPAPGARHPSPEPLPGLGCVVPHRADGPGREGRDTGPCR